MRTGFEIERSNTFSEARSAQIATVGAQDDFISEYRPQCIYDLLLSRTQL